MSKQLELRWSAVKVDVAQIISYYGKNLPQIVKAEEGYDGILEEESYAKDDVSSRVFWWRYILT